MSRVELLQEWFLERPLSNFSEKLLLKRQTAPPGCTREDYLPTELQYLNSESHPGGREPLVIMKTRPLLGYSDSDGFIKLQLSVPSSLTT